MQQIYTQLGMVAITTKKIDVNAMTLHDPLRTKKKKQKKKEKKKKRKETCNRYRLS